MPIYQSDDNNVNTKLNIDLDDYIAMKEAQFSKLEEKLKRKLHIPSTDEVKKIYSEYVPHITINEYKNKKYVDPKYAFPVEKYVIDGISLNGNFKVSSVMEDDTYILKIKDSKSGSEINFYFDDISEQMKLTKNIHTTNQIREENCDFSVESNINDNSLYTNNRKSALTTSILGTIGTILATSYVYFKRKK